MSGGEGVVEGGVVEGREGWRKRGLEGEGEVEGRGSGGGESEWWEGVVEGE